MSESSRFGILPLAISSSKQSNSLSTAAYSAAHSLLVNSIVTLADTTITPFKGIITPKRQERKENCCIHTNKKADSEMSTQDFAKLWVNKVIKGHR